MSFLVASLVAGEDTIWAVPVRVVPVALRVAFRCWWRAAAAPLQRRRLMRVGGVRRWSGCGECVCDGGQVVDVGVGGVEAEAHGGDRCVGASCLTPGVDL